jgi:hypothetical protein
VNIIDARTIEIVPDTAITDNSSYTIQMSGIADTTGNCILDATQFEVITALTPSYTDLYSVKKLLQNMPVDDQTILYNIRDASNFALYILNSTTLSSDEITYSVKEFVKFRAAHECILAVYMANASRIGDSGQMGDIRYDNTTQLKDINLLLKYLDEQTQTWQDHMRGYGISGRNRPWSTYKSKSSSQPITPANLSYTRGV